MSMESPWRRRRRSGRYELVELGGRVRPAVVLIGDDDLPAFARPHPCLRRDEQPTFPHETILRVLAFCDHPVGQCVSPACPATPPLVWCQRALAAIRREHGNLVPSTAVQTNRLGAASLADPPRFASLCAKEFTTCAQVVR